MALASWSVHATVAEPPALLVAFALHHLELGAREVHLALDRWTDETLAALRPIDGVRLTLCDAAYWERAFGARPPDQEARQIANARLCFAACRTDWFFSCDADEFLWADRPVSALLDEVPGDVWHRRTRVAERVFRAGQAHPTIFDGPVRHGTPDAARIERTYGPSARYLNRGMSGQWVGKSFVRAGAPRRIWLHFPLPWLLGRLRCALRPARVAGDVLPESWLVHYDGLTPLHWLVKRAVYARARAAALAARPLTFQAAVTALGRLTGEGRPTFRRQGPAREAQLEAVAALGRDPGSRAALLGAVVLSTRQEEDLADCLLPSPPSPAALVAAADPDLAGGLRSAEVDRLILARHAALADELGLRDLASRGPGDS